jgi:hypothetical protein
MVVCICSFDSWEAMGGESLEAEAWYSCTVRTPLKKKNVCVCVCVCVFGNLVSNGNGCLHLDCDCGFMEV